jgi:hypothetical protein
MKSAASALVTALLPFYINAPALADEVIQFKKGAVSATVRGQVSRYTKTYQFRARKGQTLTISLAPDGGDKGMLTVSVNAYCGEEYGRPLVDQALRWQGTLPCSDRYSVDVTPAVAAREPMRAQGYALTITIQ